MSRKGRGLIVTVVNNFINSLKPRRWSGDLIGKDYLGNEYYELKGTTKSSRYYKPPGNDESKFDDPLPPEWEAWLRQRRKRPPTVEEIEINLAMIKQKQENALKIEMKFKTSENHEEQTVTGLKSFPKLEEYESFPGKKKK